MMPTIGKMPKRCPFCWETSDTMWREFKVRTYVERFFDADTNGFSAPRDESFEVWCSRCGEHIRPEDIKEYDDELSMCCGASIDDAGFCAQCKEHAR